MPDAAPREREGRRRPLRLLLKALRWGFRFLALGVIIILALLHLLPFITDTSAVRGMAAEAIRRFLPGAVVRIETLRVAPLRKAVLRVRGFEIAPADAPQRPVFALAEGECLYVPAALLDGVVHVTSLSLRGARVRLERRDGAWNFAPLLGEGEEPFDFERLRLPLSVRLDAARLDDVELTVAFEDLVGLEVEAASVRGSCALAGLLEGGVELDFQCGPIAADLPGAALALPHGLEAALRARHRERRVALCGWATAAALEGDVGGHGRVASLPLRAGFGAELDVARQAVPQFGIELSVPDLVAVVGFGSVERGASWSLDGEGVAALDVGELRGILAPVAERFGASLSASGQALGTADVAGRFGAGPGEAAEVRVTGELASTGLDLAGEAGPVAADVSGLRLGAAGELGLRAARPPAGLCTMALRVMADRATAAGPQGAEIAGGPLDVHAAGRASLPALGATGLLAQVGEGEWRVAADGIGPVTVPVRAALRAEASELLDPREARIRLRELTGAAGGLLPAFGLRVDAAGYGRGGLSVAARAVADLDRLLALGQEAGLGAAGLSDLVSGSGAACGAVGLTGRLGRDGPEALRLVVDGRAGLASVAVKATGGGVGARRLHASGGLTCALGAGCLPRDAAWSGALDAEGLEAEGAWDAAGGGEPFSLRLKRVAAEAEGSVADAGLSQVEAKGHVAIAGLAASPVGVGPVSLEARGRLAANAPAGELEAGEVALVAPGLFDLSAPQFAVRGFGEEGVELEGRLRLLDLGRLADLARGLPHRQRLPALSGSVRAELRAEGRLPLAARLVAALVRGGSLPAFELFPLSAFYEREAPLGLRADVALADVSAILTDADGAAVGVEGLSGEAGLDVEQGDARGRLDLRLPLVRLPTAPVPLTDFRLAGEMALEGLNTLTLAPCTFSGLGGVVSAEASLRADGLGRLRRIPAPAELLTLLDAELAAGGRVAPGEVGVPGGLALDGELGCELEVALAAGEELTVAARPEFRGFSASLDDVFAVAGMDGGLSFAKSWSVLPPGRRRKPPLSRRVLEGAPVAEPPGMLGALPEFGTAADRLLSSGEGLSLRAVSVFGRDIMRHAAADVTMTGGRLSVPSFRLDLLGGRLVGAARFGPGSAGRQASVQGEFAGVELKGMLPADLRAFPGDSRINGSFSFGADIGATKDGAPRSPIKDISARLDVTQIGPAACDRALLALDPRGANPSIVSTRRALAVASPLRAEASLERGFVSLSVALQGLAAGLVTEYAVPRFSVAQLFEAAPVNRALSRGAAAFAALGVLDADRIEVSEEGAVRFR
jgi:hypothetical protein